MIILCTVATAATLHHLLPRIVAGTARRGEIVPGLLLTCILIIITGIEVYYHFQQYR